MMTDDMSVAEIRRNLEDIKKGMAEFRTEVRERHHTLSSQIQAHIGPVAVLTIRVEDLKNDIDEACKHVRECEKGLANTNTRAAYIAGGIATAISAVKMLIDLLKH